MKAQKSPRPKSPKSKPKSKNESGQYSRAMNAVVRIHAKGIQEHNPLAVLDPRVMIEEDWVGSGFFIRLNGQEGYILTNGHVVKNAKRLEIHSALTSDETFRVEIVGMVESMEPDVALLKMPREEIARFKSLAKVKTLPCLEFADSEKIRRGEEIKAIGYPLGMAEPNMSGGEISNFISGTPDEVERFVTDAAINPGNSGGPAITKDSKVLGLNTAIIVEASNIAFITPIHIVEHVLPTLAKGKDVTICRLGAAVQRNSKRTAAFLGQAEPTGVIVNKVLEHSIARCAGLRMNDILLGINGQLLDRYGNVIAKKSARKQTIFDLMHEVSIGDEIKLLVLRRGEKKVLSTRVKTFEMQPVPSIPIISNRKIHLYEGLVLQEACSEIFDALEVAYGADPRILYRAYVEAKSKIMITAIYEDSPADEMGLRLGEFITHVGNRPVKDLGEFSMAMIAQSKKRSEVVVRTSTGTFGVFDSAKSYFPAAVNRPAKG